MPDINQIVQEADIIVNGYAFKKNDNEIKVFDLNNGVGAAVFDLQVQLIETNMNDIELAIAQKYLENNLSLLEL